MVWALFAARLPAACAVTIKIDYEYDTNFFFSTGNPAGPAAGPQAKAALEAAAAYMSGILRDTLSPIQLPGVYQGSSGTATWHWSMIFPHPAAAGDVTKQDAIFAADEYRIYVGADSLEDNALATGGYGLTFVPNPIKTGTFNISENATINQIDGNFKNAAYKRGEATGFAAWGGAISFDRDAGTVWNYSLASPVDGANDLYSVAVHEIAHALGFGTSAEWGNLASGANFTGFAAAAAYGSAPPLESPTAQNPTRSHWANPPGNPTMSAIYGTNISQEAAMSPVLNTGTRKHFTALDAGALIDIGWEVSPPAFIPADFNRDGFVNAIDFATWKTSFGVTLEGNADGDADSDGADFLAWQRTRGASAFAASLGATAAVPEPVSLALLSWLALPVAARRLRSRSLEKTG